MERLELTVCSCIGANVEALPKCGLQSTKVKLTTKDN